MTARILPYASTPGRAMFQLLSDVFIVLWIIVWYSIGRLVFKAVSAVAEVGHQVRDGADGVTRNLDSAGSSAAKIPLVGDTVRNPLHAAATGAHQLAVAGQNMNDKLDTLAIVLSLAIAVPPVLMVAVPWLLLRLRFARRANATAKLAAIPGGERMLALRALVNRPLTKVSAAAPGQDPLEAWRDEDPDVLRRLATLELRRSGLRVPKAWKASVKGSSKGVQPSG